METLHQALINDLSPLASIGPDDDGMETVEYYVLNHYDPAKTYEENLNDIGQMITEDQ